MRWVTAGTYGVAVLHGLVYSYRVELPTDEFFGLIWLQDHTTHEQWFTRYGFTIPVETVLRSLMNSLEASRRFSSRCRGEQKLALRNVFGDKYLIAPVQVVVHGVRWGATYTFPLKLVRSYATSLPTATTMHSGCRTFDSDGDDDSGGDDCDERDDER